MYLDIFLPFRRAWQNVLKWLDLNEGKEMLRYIFFIFSFVCLFLLYLSSVSPNFSIYVASVRSLVSVEQQSEVKGMYLVIHLFKLPLRHIPFLHLYFLCARWPTDWSAIGHNIVTYACEAANSLSKVPYLSAKSQAHP